MFSIGEFSKITALSVKSLRIYHDKGLLIPANIDSFTGYRYYDDDNFETAKTIRTLRQLDFSLALRRSGSWLPPFGPRIMVYVPFG